VNSRQADYIDLYFRYRVVRSRTDSSNQAERQRSRRKWLPVFVIGLLALAGAFLGYAARGSGDVYDWTGIALLFSVLALVLTTGIVASASPVSQIARAHADMATALSAVRQLDPGASEQELAVWVAEVESILRRVPPGTREVNVGDVGASQSAAAEAS
jgi:hypothetical protein